MSTYIAIPQTRNRKLVHCHLLGDSREELERIAAEIGVGPSQLRRGAEAYYVLRVSQARRARELGAKSATIACLDERLLRHRNERLAKRSESHESTTQAPESVRSGDRIQDNETGAGRSTRVGAATPSRAHQ